MTWVLDGRNFGRFSGGFIHPNICRHNGEVIPFGHDQNKGICYGCGYQVKNDTPQQETWDLEAE